MLHTTLQTDMQQAMKDQDKVRLNTLRLALAACTEELVASKRKPVDRLSDEETIAVLRRVVKQRKESAERYRSANYSDRAAAEDAERAVLESYLPSMLSEEDVHSVVLQHKKRLGVSEKKDIGQLIQSVMAELGDRADGSAVAKIAAVELS